MALAAQHRAAHTPSLSNLVAIAALITALVGVAALIYQIKGSTSAEQRVMVRESAMGASADALGRTPYAGFPSASSVAGDISSIPLALLFGNNGVDLDADPPKLDSTSDIDIYDGGGSIVSYPIWPGLVKWNQSSIPSRSDCVNLLNSFAIVSSVYVKGDRYCVRTRNERHLAVVEFIEPSEGGWKIQVAVWPGVSR